MEREQKLQLSNLCQGGAEQIFQRDLAKVLENIADINTPPDGVREITLKLKFVPTIDRRSAMVTFSSATKLSGVADVMGKVYFTREGSELRAYPENPSQTALFGASQTDRSQ